MASDQTPHITPTPPTPAAAPKHGAPKHGAPNHGAPNHGAPTHSGSEERERSRRIGSLMGLLPFLWPHRVMVAGAIVALIATAMVSLTLPLAVRRVVDGFETENAALLDQYFLAALAIAGLLALGTGARYYLVTRLGERVVADIRKAVFERMIAMSPAFYERIMTGEVLSRITTDTTLLLSVISSSVSIALRNLLILLGGVGLMLWTSPKLAGAVLLIVPLVIVPIVVLGRRLRVLSRQNQDWIAESSGNASEALLSAQTVQAFTHEGPTAKRFSDVTELSFGSAKKRIATRAAMTVIVIALVFTGVVGVLWVGARDVRAEVMSVGALIQFLIYAIMVAGSVGALSEIWGELQRAAGATERLVELLQTEDTVADPQNGVALPLGGRGEITFSDVRFHYPTRPEIAALDGVSFTVKPGETVALVGPSGAGKSTVFQLLQRFYDPDSGQITLDGVALADMERQVFRGAIAMVPQDPVIFAASARENIRFGRPDATDAEVEAAALAAAAHTFLSALPKGYDTYVGERGMMLSGGQKQRIAIARAILRDAPILLLDEATSALDAESERAVQDAVGELSKTRTTLIVAHRLATVKQADRILVFDGGQIVAEGTHDGLVAAGGLYARLARLQFTTGLAAE
ncbi:MAG: ATP-binding cassette domain-containing protein [Roseicyclus sp.]|nr:ATP-binding cassette domain-containing protein [Roseicyclus sp.]